LVARLTASKTGGQKFIFPSALPARRFWVASGFRFQNIAFVIIQSTNYLKKLNPLDNKISRIYYINKH
jgi:hypothetical protein